MLYFADLIENCTHDASSIEGFSFSFEVKSCMKNVWLSFSPWEKRKEVLTPFMPLKKECIKDIARADH